MELLCTTVNIVIHDVKCHESLLLGRTGNTTSCLPDRGNRSDSPIRGVFAGQNLRSGPLP